MIPGLPPLLRPPTTIAGVTKLANTASLLSADSALLTRQFFVSERWGIYLKGALQLAPDSVKSFDYRQASKISDYPQEKGAFQSYNKVATPFDARVELTKGGNQRDRSDFLAALEKAAASLELFDVVTPEKTYISANIERVSLVRTASAGLGLLTAEIWLTEVRQAGKTAFANTKAAGGMTPVQVGTVQSQSPSADIQSAIGKVLPSMGGAGSGSMLDRGIR